MVMFMSNEHFIFVLGELKSLSLPRGFLPELTEHVEQGKEDNLL